jgi:hypothetical protein
MASLAKLRTRWAAIGAACAVTLGGGTLGIVQASVSSGDRAVYVPITPVRVLDTRSDVGVATVQDATPALLTVTGSIATTSGQQNVVPTGASSVVINVTAINPTSDGFVSLRPGDATGAPAVSTLNVTVGGTFPNGATITLPTSGGSAGQIQIWYEAYAATGGTTDLLIDVVGYYADHNHDDRYYTETEVDTALAGKANASDLTSGLAGKANASDLTSGLASKANASDLAIGLAGKANTTEVDETLNHKADIDLILPPLVPSAPNTLDSEGSMGYYSAIAIGIDGNPVIAYQDGSNRDVKVAFCNDPGCTSATFTSLDSAHAVGGYISIAINADGNPFISYAEYVDNTNRDLKIAACHDPRCTEANIETLDSVNDVGFYTSTAIGVNGNPIISYRDNSSGTLKLAICDNPTCTSSTTNTIDPAAGSGYFTSIGIGTNGNPIISYGNNSSNDLYVAACDDQSCSSATITDVDSIGNVGYYNSLAIGTYGLPIISYYDETRTALKIAICEDPICSVSTLIDLDNNGNVGKNTSLAIGTNGSPIISYADDSNGNLKLATCYNLACTAANYSTIDPVGGVGWDSSIAIGINGNPIISYLDAVNRDLKVISPWWVVGGR